MKLPGRVPVPEIVLGPPGTGKTTTLLGYVEDALARGVPSDQIGYLSFTRRAASEAASRASKRFSRDPDDFPYFRTIHSLCFRFLGLSGADVMERQKLQEFAEEAGVRINGRWSEDGNLSGFDTGDRIIFMENLSRIRGITLLEQYQEFNDDLPWNVVDRVARHLRQFKEENSLMDYTDMLVEFVRQGARPRLRELYVDEAQDLSTAQWNVIRLLAAGCDRVVVAGDDDQAIYRWAGANVDKFIDMQGDVRVLDQSWRVPILVQQEAGHPIGYVRRRREKAWRPREEEGTIERMPSFRHCEYTGNDVLILARNDYVLREQIEPVLRRYGVIYEKHGFPSVRASVMDAIVNWERLRRGESVAGEDARRVYKTIRVDTGIKRGFKELKHVDDDQMVDMTYLRESGGLLTDKVWHEALTLIPDADVNYILNARRHGEQLSKKPRVRISTIHGAKGGEADHVILMKEMARRTYAEMQENPEDEARVWYVGATRARKRLTLVQGQTQQECPWL